MTEFVTAADGVRIAYEVQGDGKPVVLIHGFGASRTLTWGNTGWYPTLTRAGYQVIAIDCRGHGGSDKPHEIPSYEEGRMAADPLYVLDALDISSANVMGYSMGGILAIRLMHDRPSRVQCAVLAGLGQNYFEMSGRNSEIIAQGLLAEDPATITDPQARDFRTFCERAGNDLVALAACIRRERRALTEAELKALSHEALVVCGAEDNLAGSPDPLANALGHARALVVPKRNHHSTVGDRVYKDAVLEFLSG